MSMISHYFDYTEIGERTKLQLFREAYRAFNASIYFLGFETWELKEDPEIKAFSDRGEMIYKEITQILRILGIYDEFQTTTEIDVETALNEGITYQEAHDKRIFAAA